MKKTINLLIILIGFTSFVNAQVMVSTLAGSTTAGSVDGTASVAKFARPHGICLTIPPFGAISGDILVADGNDKIRKITPSGLVTTPQYGIDGSSPLQYATTYYTRGGICKDPFGNFYFSAGNSITKITQSGNLIFNFAGQDGSQGDVDGMGSNARFYDPAGICTDPSGNIYLADIGAGGGGKIKKITPNGMVSTFISSIYTIGGICSDLSGNLYFTSKNNSGNNAVYKSTPTGVLTLVAGGASSGLMSVRYGEGTVGSNVTFPTTVRGICIDNIGNLYVTGVYNIQKIDTNGAVTTFAGPKYLNASGTGVNNQFTGGYIDGPGDIAKFSYPLGGAYGENFICTDNYGNFYVSDSSNNCIRKISVIPTFTQIPPICYGSNLVLPSTSNNGLTGTWSPAINNTATTTYTFTPTGGNGISTTMTVDVNPNITPTFQQVNSICSGAILSDLPTTSNNTITGTWSPALNNTATTTYTFTPAIGQCATTATMTITVNLLPANAGIISGNATVCQGQTSVFYTVPNITNATSYVWTLPSGATGTSTTNTINVNYSSSSVSGNLIVSGNNSCGNGASFSLPITVISTQPPTGNISQNLTQGQTLNNLQVTGTNLIWYANQYDAINHVSPITNTTLLVNGVTYYVTQTNNGCESSPLAITVTVALGLNDFPKDKFIYYPNPLSSVVNFENNNTILKITLFNLLGQRVEEKEINSLSGQLDMSKLPTGNYLLKLKTYNGESTIKLVKN